MTILTGVITNVGEVDKGLGATFQLDRETEAHPPLTTFIPLTQQQCGEVAHLFGKRITITINLIAE